MLKMFSVFDAKANAFITPFFLPTKAMAVREFEYVSNQPDHMFCKYASDYTLYLIGDFDDSTAAVNCLERPEVLGTAASFKRDYVANNVNPEDESRN